MPAASGSFLSARPIPSPVPAMRPPRQLVPVALRAKRPADQLRPADPSNTGRRSSSWLPAPPYSPWNQYPQPR